MVNHILAQVFTIVFPLVLVVGSGYLYARKQAADVEFLNRANMDIFTPALILDVLVVREFNIAEYQWLAFGGFWVVIGSALVAWPLLKWLGFNVRALMPSMMFNNSGNLGIPLAVLAFGEQILPAAVILWLVSMFLNMSLGVLMINKEYDWLSPFRTPMIVAAVLGLAMSINHWSVPTFVEPAITMMGQVSIPLMLFALGVRIASVQVSQWRLGVIGGLLCPLSGLAIAAILVLLLPLEREQIAMLVLFSIMPPALMNYMLAERYNTAPADVAQVVIAGNLLGALVVPLVLVWLV